ncbi:MAG: hypothetical protein FWF10_04980 [Clostridiales bacterium]|nr:hypothetical protein [Clostridiales bacterium]
MLGKLFKHDMRALSRWMRFVVLGIISLALLITVSIAIDTQYYDSIVQSIQVMVMGLGVMGLYASVIITAVFVYVHYYRSMFSDEGYLTHTLPAKSWHILLSKLLSSLLWMFISTLSLVLGVFIIAWVTVGDLYFISSALRSIGEYVNAATVIMAPADLLISSVSGLLQIFLAITIGCAIANKHRFWAAFGIYAAISACSGLINSIFGFPTFITLMFSYDDANITNNANIMLMIDLIKNCAIATICFFWINRLLKRRLNLQ